MAKKTLKRDAMLTIVFGLLLSAICFYSYSLKNDPIDTRVVNGVYQDFKIIKSGKTSDQYIMILDDIDYNIPSIYQEAFNEDQFFEVVTVGDTLRLVLTNSKTIYQVSNGTLDFIQNDKRESAISFNFDVALILGIVSLLMACYSLYKYVGISK